MCIKLSPLSNFSLHSGGKGVCVCLSLCFVFCNFQLIKKKKRTEGRKNSQLYIFKFISHTVVEFVPQCVSASRGDKRKIGLHSKLMCQPKEGRSSPATELTVSGEGRKDTIKPARILVSYHFIRASLFRILSEITSIIQRPTPTPTLALFSFRLSLSSSPVTSLLVANLRNWDGCC